MHYEEKHRYKLTQTKVVRPGGAKLYEVPIPQSGQIGFYRDYKEPLRPLETGYGYEGVLLYDISMRKVQCHFCGEWFQSLGTHIRKHGLNKVTYKAEYGLMKTTALQGEPMREHAIRMGEKLYRRSKEDPLVAEKRDKAARIAHHGGKRSTAEEKNKKGTCAAQLLAHLRANPSMTMHDPGSHQQPIIATFGSWNRARKLARLPAHQDRVDLALALEGLRAFAAHHGRAPFMSDCRRGLLPYGACAYRRRFGSWRAAVVQAGLVPREQHTGGLKYAAYYDEWIKLYESGQTAKEIAFAYRCGDGTVRAALQARGCWIGRFANKAQRVRPLAEEPRGREGGIAG